MYSAPTSAMTLETKLLIVLGAREWMNSLKSKLGPTLRSGGVLRLGRL